MDVPAYSPTEVARIVGMSVNAVRSWTYGMSYGSSKDKGWFHPIIISPETHPRRLTFRNLVEVYVLHSLRRQHKISMNAIRQAVDLMRSAAKTEHPLVDLDLMTDGRDIFLDAWGGIFNTSRSGQRMIPEAVRVYLERVDREGHGPVRFFPITRKDAKTSPREVVIDPRRKFGRPYVVACGVEVDVIRKRFNAGDSLATLSEEFGCTVEQIEEALCKYAEAA